jgi:hypothetical protein
MSDYLDASGESVFLSCSSNHFFVVLFWQSCRSPGLQSSLQGGQKLVLSRAALETSIAPLGCRMCGGGVISPHGLQAGHGEATLEQSGLL